MTHAKGLRPLRAKILLRVVPFTALVMLGILWVAQQSIRATIESEVESRLSQAATLTAEQLGRQLDLLRASVSGIAENDLVVNSIVDKEQRKYQIPIFFRSLRLPDTSFRCVTMTDYAGRPIVSSSRDQQIEVEPFLAEVMAGENYFEIDRRWITVASPITYGGNPEGVLAVRFDTAAFLSGFQAITRGQRFSLLLEQETLYESQLDSTATTWNVAARRLDDYPRLIAQRAESTEIAFSAMRSLNLFLFGILIAALVAVLSAVLAASIISARPLANIVSQIRSIESSEDLSRRVELKDSLEFHELSDSFNGMIENLSRKTVSLDKLIESETQLRVANAKLRRSNEELEQFANVASHDLQEPLRILTSYCELMREDCYDALTEDGHRYMRYVVDAARRMRTLIQDLLAYSKIETHGQDLIMVDTDKVVRLAIDEMREEIIASQARVVVDPLPVIEADPIQLSQLFRHLIGNAIKYRGAKNPEIRISALSKSDEWSFRIEDNGIGIKPEYCERIFGIFQRLHRRDMYPGTGIGLALCKRIVDRLHGKIWVESEPAVGSVFHVSIPRRPHESGTVIAPNIPLPDQASVKTVV